MKTFVAFAFLLCVWFSAQAQDVLIKTDKTEVKVKVLEIADEVIKYKDWQFQDGPTYSIRKGEVFMIIYQNGKRETFESAAPAPRTTNVPAPQQNRAAVHTAAEEAAPTGEAPEIFYRPWRITAALIGTNGAPEGMMADYSKDFRLKFIPKYVNWGVNLSFSVLSQEIRSGSSGHTTISVISPGFGAYVLGYAPVNQLLGKIEKQDKGFFPFLRVGGMFSSTLTTIEKYPGLGADPEVTEDTVGPNFNFDWSFGADYKFTRKFGLTTLINDDIFAFGINFNF